METQRAVGYYEIPRTGRGQILDNTLRDTSRIPVGRGMKDVQLLVLNKVNQLSGLFEIGEICIRSPHLALGYLSDDELTNQRFVQNSFSKTRNDNISGTRDEEISETRDDKISETRDDKIYKTGDFGYCNAEGNVMYTGRKEGQISIRGYRIERADVESVLRSCPAVEFAAVGFGPDSLGDQRIVAYVVPSEPGQFQSSSLISFLKSRLPRYMVPSAIVQLEELPLSPNGKIIYARLPEPVRGRDLLTIEFITPDTDYEIRLAKIWS